MMAGNHQSPEGGDRVSLHRIYTKSTYKACHKINVKAGNDAICDIVAACANSHNIQQ